MKIVDRDTVAASFISALELDPSIHAPDSDEAIAAAIRRVAAMSCPCVRSSIVRAVAGALRPIVIEGPELQERVDEMIDSLVGHGDLAELRASENEFERATWLLHAAPPAFVRRESGAVLLLGIAPDEIFPLPGGLQRRIQYRGHVRLLEEDSSGNLPAYLSDFGLLELSSKTWLSAPPRSDAHTMLGEANAQLDAASRAGSIPDLRILDWQTPVTYYRTRWLEPKRQTGRFVARRPQSYGAPLWCYVELEQGQPRRLFDFPRDEREARGCDEAWRVQAAIDATRGQPQLYRRREDSEGVTIDFFAPLPRWADRRFTAFGEVVPRRRCLFSRRFSQSEIAEELHYINDELWLAEAKES